MPLDGKALSAALNQTINLRTELCRRDVSALDGRLQGVDDLAIACTQEAPLFSELALSAKSVAPLRFINIRETGGWSSEAKSATPKIAALLALAALPEPDPVATVSYQSQGRTLILGRGKDALQWAEKLKGQLAVTVLVTEGMAGGELPPTREFSVVSGKLHSLTGWLGGFKATWGQENPIDLEACTRCNKCIEACPEGAIDFGYQIDLDKCKGHRACVRACGEIQAINFARSDSRNEEEFDLVLDFSATPAFAMHQPPQGYLHAGHDALKQAIAAAQAATMVGEFEKPKFFNYKSSLCAHSRSEKQGCNACIDICSTKAISHAGEHVKVEPHLCMGCGACATVCPSGAMTYQYPNAKDLGLRLKTALATYGKAGGKDACILLHDAAGRSMIGDLGRQAARKHSAGMPARMIPLEVHHVASTGLDLWLAALAYGAAQVVVLATGDEAPQYVEALRGQMAVGNAITSALGFTGGTALQVLPAADAIALNAGLQALVQAPAPKSVKERATFNASLEKRTTLEFAIEHLQKQGGAGLSEIPLSKPSPFGTLQVDTGKCTLCLACVGACPSKALADNPETPQLRFIEKNCVQCGLCANTCPEDAITLLPRLLLTDAAKKPHVLNEAQPFHCIKCAKPFGTKQMVDGMLAKLTSHSMFAGGAINRLQMCADCRVVDIYTAENELKITQVKKGSY